MIEITHHPIFKLGSLKSQLDEFLDEKRNRKIKQHQFKINLANGIRDNSDYCTNDFNDEKLIEDIRNLKETIDRCSNFFINLSIWRNKERIFCLIYVSWEGIDTYKRLYLNRNIFPKALTIIQPGEAFGGNWTNFNDPNGLLWTEIKKGQLPKDLCIGTYIFRNQYPIPSVDLYIRKEDDGYSKRLARRLTERNIQLFELDLRSNDEKLEDEKLQELQRIENEEWANNSRLLQQKVYEENIQKAKLARPTQYAEWWENYQKSRSLFKKGPRFKSPFNTLTYEEELLKQEFDKRINKIKASIDTFNAIRRKDFLAVKALINKGADFNYKINKITLFEFALSKNIDLNSFLSD
jgi:hypothetical protein